MGWRAAMTGAGRPAEDAAGHALARRLVPAAVAVAVAGGVAAGGSSAGFFGAAVAVAIPTIAGGAALLVAVVAAAQAFDRAWAQRRVAERALRRERDYFGAVMASLDDGIVVRDAEGRIIEVSDRWCRRTGFPRSEIVGAVPPYPWWPADGAAELGASLERARRAGDRGRYDATFATRDGLALPVVVTHAPLRDADGRTIASITTYGDIGDRVEAERAVRASEARFRAALDAGLDAFFVLHAVRDEDGVITDFVFDEANRRGAALLGRPREELLGALLGDVIPALRTSGALRRYASVVETGEALAGEVRVKAHAVAADWIEQTVVPLGDGIAISARDISDRKRAATELHEVQEQLRLAFDEAPIGMLLADPGGAIRAVNDSLCAFLGYDAETLRCTTIGSLVHGDDAVAWAEQTRRLLDGLQRTCSLEARFRHATGEAAWGQLSMSVVRGADGRPRYLLGHVEDIADRRRYEGQLQWMADHDSLTGLLNRRRFEQELELHLEGVDPAGALLVLDIDGFKTVNDTLGHAAGDELITSVATLLRGRLRESDVVARLGGDEFAVLLRSGSEHDARAVAEAICQDVRERTVAIGDGARLRVTASVGIALLADCTGLAIEAVLAVRRQRDVRRQGGGPRPSRGALAGQRPARAHQVARGLGRAPARGARERRPGAAGSTRHRHRDRRRAAARAARAPDRPRRAPRHARGVPARGRALGLVTELDRQVVRRAIALAARCEAAGRPATFEVNISGRSLAGTGLADLIEAELESTGTPGARLVLGIAERSAVADIEAARRFAERMHALGCGIVLEDFGDGLGSFPYLQHLPFDLLKIDGDLVQRAVTGPTDQLVVQALAQITRGLGKRAVGTAIEDAEALDMLRRCGIELAQGHHVGSPLPAEQALGLEGESGRKRRRRRRGPSGLAPSERYVSRRSA